MIFHEQKESHPSHPIERICRVYGVCTRVMTSDSFVGELIADSFGPWDTLRPEDLAQNRSPTCFVTVRAPRPEDLTVDFGRVESPTLLRLRKPPTYLVHPTKVLGKNDHCEMLADRTKNGASILVSREYLDEHPNDFQRNFLECAVQFLASAEDRVPLHAAAAELHGHLILLIGPSGSGKSTLLYALARRGCKVLAEEHLCIAYKDEFALWGAAREIGLRADILEYFPELRDEQVSEQPNQKLKYMAPLKYAQRAYPKHRGPVKLLFLSTGAPREGLRTVDRDEARHRLLHDREPGFDLATEYADAVEVLIANASAYELTRNERPIPTAEMLCAWVKGL